MYITRSHSHIELLLHLTSIHKLKPSPLAPYKQKEAL